MELEKLIDLLEKLGKHLLSEDEEWIKAQDRALNANAWFTKESIQLSVKNIVHQFLNKEQLQQWLEGYTLPVSHQKIGIITAGNIPLVGFHDFLCGLVSGHTLLLKLSSKDEHLMKHIAHQLIQWEPALKEKIIIADTLKEATAYIATGSNNSARYFEQYFAKHPNIIRRNRTSVAVLDGTETKEELQSLAFDIFSYFGLGCRNVTQICVPTGYSFEPLLELYSEYKELLNFHKYKNNYDYHLAIYLLNKVPCFTNEVLLLVENDLPFSAVSVLHYRYYSDKDALLKELNNSNDIQAIVGHDGIPFGDAQTPRLNDYADGVDTLKFLCEL